MKTAELMIEKLSFVYCPFCGSELRAENALVLECTKDRDPECKGRFMTDRRFGDVEKDKEFWILKWYVV